MALAQLNQNGQQPSPRRDSMDNSLSDVEERLMFEGQKAYIIVNAVGAVVLLVFLQAIWPNPGALLLKKGVLWGIVAFGAGVAVATLGYALRLWSLRRSGPRFQALRMQVAARDHLYGTEEEVLLAVRLAAARLPGRPLEPHRPRRPGSRPGRGHARPVVGRARIGS